MQNIIYVNQATTEMVSHLRNSSINTCLYGSNFQYDVRIGRTITRVRKPRYIMTSALVLKEIKSSKIIVKVNYNNDQLKYVTGIL